jgi:hypothetical protein
MLSLIKSRGLLLITLLVSSAIFSSFKPVAGGEGFEIYLNNKLVMQRFGSQLNSVQDLQLDKRSANDQLIIKYHHCGKVGKNRVVTIRDERDRILKEWRFEDAARPVAAMTCNVKEILSLDKIRTNKLKLYYASTELPAGRQLASISFGGKDVAAR